MVTLTIHHTTVLDPFIWKLRYFLFANKTWRPNDRKEEFAVITRSNIFVIDFQNINLTVTKWQKISKALLKIYLCFQLNDLLFEWLTFLLFSQIAKICSLNACQHFDITILSPRPHSRNLSPPSPRWARVYWSGRPLPGPNLAGTDGARTNHESTLATLRTRTLTFSHLSNAT